MNLTEQAAHASAAHASSAKGGRTIAVRWIAAIAILLGVFFRGYHLDYKTFWEDEIIGTFHMLGFTEDEIVRSSPAVRTAADIQGYFHVTDGTRRTGRPLTATVSSLVSEDPQHTPLYYLLVRLWVDAAGTSVLALRLLPALFGVVGVGAMYWFASELFGNSRLATIAAALYAVSPIAVLYSQEAREYSLWVVMTLVSSTLLLRAARTRRPGWWVAYGASSVISLYIYPLAALVIGAQGFTVLLSSDLRRKSIIGPFLLAAGSAVLLFVPWLTVMYAAPGMRGFANMMAARLSPRAIALFFSRDIKLSIVDLGQVDGRVLHWTITVAGTAALVLLAYASWLLAQRCRWSSRTILLFMLVVIPALPLLLHDVVSGGMLVAQSRYFEPVYLAVTILLAFLLETRITEAVPGNWRTSAWISIFGAGVLLGTASCAVSSQAATWYNKDYERTPAVAAIIDSSPHPLIVVDESSSRELGLAFYLRATDAMWVRAHCFICEVNLPDPGKPFADTAGFSDVFVLGKVSGAPSVGTKIRRVGVLTYPRTTEPLDMFGSAQ